jgi:hypothetical protein
MDEQKRMLRQRKNKADKRFIKESKEQSKIMFY